MTASIDTTGLALMSNAVRRVVTGSLQKELVKNLHDAQRPILSDIQGSAFTGIQRHAAASVVTRRTAVGIDIEGGATGGLNSILWAGGEYGGRSSKRKTYATRSRLGNAYIVRRRTTMQFLPHLGREGYMMWPTIREWLPKLIKQQEALIEKALGGR